jgi:hypothetical protein
MNIKSAITNWHCTPATDEYTCKVQLWVDANELKEFMKREMAMGDFAEVLRDKLYDSALGCLAAGAKNVTDGYIYKCPEE